MKRINRINYLIYMLVFALIYFLIIFAIIDWEVLWKDYFTIEQFVLICIILSIPFFIILIKRGYDINKDIISTIANNINPFFFIYLVFKKWDIWNNQFWGTDNKIIFITMDTKKRNNIFEKIFYCKFLWPIFPEKEKDLIIKSKKGRIMVLLYPVIFFLLLGVIAIIMDINNILNNDEYIWIFIIYFIIYRFYLVIYYNVINYIKNWK